MALIKLWMVAMLGNEFREVQKEMLVDYDTNLTRLPSYFDNNYLGIKEMKTATIYKDEVSNPNIWKLIIIELGLPKDTDEITVKAVSCSSESKRKQ